MKITDPRPSQQIIAAESAIRELENEICDFIDTKLMDLLSTHGVVAAIGAWTECLPAYVAAHGDKKFTQFARGREMFFTKVTARIERPVEEEDFSTGDLNVDASGEPLLTEAEKSAVNEAV
jgi:hypothetical protein